MRLGFLFLALSFSATAAAQIPAVSEMVPSPTPGVGHDYIENNIETVNPADGTLSMRIHVPLPPSRGFNIPFAYAYDSSSAYYGVSMQQTVTPFSQGGWSYTVPAISAQVTSVSYLYDIDNAGDEAQMDCPVLTNYVFQGPSGHHDNLGLTLVSDNAQCRQNFGEDVNVTTMSSLQAITNPDWGGGTYTNPVDVIDADGTDYSFPSFDPLQAPCPQSGICQAQAIYPTTITDRNGNQIQLQEGGLTYVDSTGRTILGGGTIVGGLSQPYRITTQTVPYGRYSMNTVLDAIPGTNLSSCIPSGVSQVYNQNSLTTQVFTSIQLPNGQQYSFQYDPTYGLVDKITYPDGGYVRYVWGVNSLSTFQLAYVVSSSYANGNGNLPIWYPNVQPTGGCGYKFDKPAILQRYVSYDGTNEVEQQDFSYTTTWPNASQYGGWLQKTTTVVTRDLVQHTQYQTIYTYSGSSVGTNQGYNAAPAASGEIAVEKTIQYYGTDGALLKTVNKTWEDLEHMTQQQTVDNTIGMFSESDWQYDNNGMLMYKNDYDYGQWVQGGQSTQGPLLRSTVYPSYHTFTRASNNLSYPPYSVTHIVDKPDSVQLLDGAGNVAAGVSYGYDTTANMTSVSKWLNSTGTPSLATDLQYDSFGNITQVTDTQGNYTQYSYADQFVDSCTYTSPSNTYLTNITKMTTNGIQHQQSFTYHCASGLLASSTDENSQLTSYIYQDSLNRLTETDYPLGWGKSTITYNDTGHTVESKRIDSSGGVKSDTITYYDGTNRPVSQSSASGETTPWNRKDTCYDGLGHVFKSTYAYQSSQAYSTGYPNSGPYCTAEGDTFAYDALGRATSVTHSDFTVASTSYTGRAVDVKDEGNGTHPVERITQSDALGRLLYVCEVTGQTQYSASPASCGLDYSGTGFLTQYQYTALGDLKTVNQGGETRGFTYDMTSRLLTATNPENGTITYAYDNDSQCTAQSTYWGELISKTDARGVRTCMQYDVLHRVVGKSYSGGNTTPAVTYGYDQTFGATQDFPVGRLTSESTSGPNPTGSIFAYDNMGHITDNSQCTPQNCGTSMFSVTYSGYNVLGEPTSATDGAGNTYTYGYNSFGKLASLNSSMNDANHPGTLLSNIHYNAFGEPVTSTIGSAPLTDLRGYDARGRLGSIWVGNTTSVTPSSGTVTINGTENGRGSATYSTGSIGIGGVENDWQNCDDAGDCTDNYDFGVITVNVGPYTYYVSYGQEDTGATLAASLASQMQGTFSNVSCISTGEYSSTVNFTSTSKGLSANYALSTTAFSYVFNTPSFSAGFSNGTSSGNTATGTMTGGNDISGPWDTGTVSVTVGGGTSTVPYGSADTDSTIASAMAAQINDDSATVTATASGSVVTITSNTPGAASDYTITATSASTAGFGSASFTPSPASGGLTGGAGTAVYSVGINYLPDGNIESSNDSVNGYWLYQYDDFNRLSTAVSNTNLGCAYTYDQYGNQWGHSGYSGGSCGTDPTYGPNIVNNNQIAQLAPYYDAAGNLGSDGITSYTYDAENRISAVGPGSTATYVYDAEGRRVRKTSSAGTVDYVYDLSGHVITEINATPGSMGSWNRGEVYAGGQHVATYDNGMTYFTHADWLGTERLRSNVAGTAVSGSNWTSYPFGEGSSTPNPGPTHFTGKERDTESGLDYFGARYMASSMGRFMSPDWSDTPMAIPYGDLMNPQSLNMYAYVGNNPLSNVDDDGHATDCGGGGDKSVVCLVTSAWDWLKSHLGGSGSGSGSGSSNGDVAPVGGPPQNTTPQLHTRPAPTPGTVNNQQFANWMNNNAQDHSTGRCAAYCRQGLEAGGLNTAGHPVDAKNYGPFLLQHGYHVVQDGNYFGNQHVGDIAVFQPAPGHSQSGHIETWTGSGWVSDFKQNRFSPYHGLGPSDLDYKIYRQQ